MLKLKKLETIIITRKIASILKLNYNLYLDEDEYDVSAIYYLFVGIITGDNVVFGIRWKCNPNGTMSLIMCRPTVDDALCLINEWIDSIKLLPQYEILIKKINSFSKKIDLQTFASMHFCLYNHKYTKHYWFSDYDYIKREMPWLSLPVIKNTLKKIEEFEQFKKDNCKPVNKIEDIFIKRNT